MRILYYIIIAIMAVFVVDITTMPARAIQAPKSDDIDALLARMDNHINHAAKVTQIAKEHTEAMVEEKVVEKQELETKMELLETVCEVYAVPVPKSMDDLEYEMRADSIRVSNMQKLNEKVD